MAERIGIKNPTSLLEDCSPLGHVAYKISPSLSETSFPNLGAAWFFFLLYFLEVGTDPSTLVLINGYVSVSR